MPQPKKKTSNSKTGHRRAHWNNALKLPNLSTCPTCHAARLPHTLCQSCKTYNGRQYGVQA
jgi:large subunit ribosomal protein L32